MTSYRDSQSRKQWAVNALLVVCLVGFLWPSFGTGVIDSSRADTISLGLPFSPWLTYHEVAVHSASNTQRSSGSSTNDDGGGLGMQNEIRATDHVAQLVATEDDRPGVALGGEMVTCNPLSVSMALGLILAGFLIARIWQDRKDFAARRKTRISPFYRAGASPVSPLAATPAPPSQGEPPIMRDGSG